jgi:hypothetical protein
MMKRISFFLVCTLVSVCASSAKSDRYTPFAASGFPDEAHRGVLWFSDASGKIIRADLHGFTLREAIETVASMSRLKVLIDECPDTFISVSITDDEPVEALRRLVRKYDLLITEAPDGSYRIGRGSIRGDGRSEAERKTSDG